MLVSFVPMLCYIVIVHQATDVSVHRKEECVRTAVRADTRLQHLPEHSHSPFQVVCLRSAA